MKLMGLNDLASLIPDGALLAVPPDYSGVAKKHLDSGIWPRPQLAHRVKRSKVVAELGKENEWHPRVLWLTHPKCNDGAMLGGAHPLDEAALFAEIRGESQNAPVRPLGESA